MESIDIFRLRGYCARRGVLLCFNGSISQRLIEETGNVLKDSLLAYNASQSKVVDVFGVFIEMTQNVCHYAAARNTDGATTLLVTKDAKGRYLVEICNLVEKSEGDALLKRVGELAKMDKTQLKAIYKARLHPAAGTHTSGDTGLGLIDVARKTSERLCARLRSVNTTCSLFSLQAII